MTMAGNRVGSDRGTQVFFMFLSAGIFAYFGFAGGWAHQYTTTTPPVLLPMVVVLKWTLRAGAIGMGLAAILTMGGSIAGPLLYAIVGLLTALAFVTVGIWEMTNSQGYYSGVPAIILFVFAAWNGFNSWMGLKEALNNRRTIDSRDEMAGNESATRKP
jgi:hypothetical protein